MEFTSITTKDTIIHKMKCHSTMSTADGNIYRPWETRFTLPVTDEYRMSTGMDRLQPWFRFWKTGYTGGPLSRSHLEGLPRHSNGKGLM